MKSYVVLDLETTGLQPKTDRILEIGALKIENGEVADSYHKMIDPRMRIPCRIQQLTGITQSMAEQGETIEEILPGFLEFCSDLPLLGHNILFDYSFIKHKAVNQGLEFEKQAVDTLKIARKVLPDLESRSLVSLCRYYDIRQEHAHRALDDARSTWQLYCHLKREFEENYPQEFIPKDLICRVKRQGPITISQKVYLNDLIKYHRIEKDIEIDSLTKSEASKMIDNIILNYGRIKR